MCQFCSIYRSKIEIPESGHIANYHVFFRGRTGSARSGNKEHHGCDDYKGLFHVIRLLSAGNL